MRAIFDLGGDDGLLRGGRRGGPFVVVGLGEVERDEWDLVDGAVFGEVGVGRGAQETALDLAEGPCRETRARFQLAPFPVHIHREQQHRNADWHPVHRNTRHQHEQHTPSQLTSYSSLGFYNGTFSLKKKKREKRKTQTDKKKKKIVSC